MVNLTMNNSRFVLLAVLVLLGCNRAPSLSAAERKTTQRAGYPHIEIRDNAAGTRVFWDDQLLVDVKENRFLRFRATPLDEKWVGSEKSPIDLGWVYRDEGAKGLVVFDSRHENNPEKGTFSLHIRGKKPQFESQIEVALTGDWMPDLGKFKYALNTRLSCSLETWYEHSTFAQRGRAVDGKAKLWTEVLDYCIEGISTPERLMSSNPKHQKGRLLYEWFVKSSDGENWEKWPKVHIPYPVRPGDYITIRDLARPSTTGAYYGFLDNALGGWMTRIRRTPFPVIFEICWARFDVHVLLEGAIPPRDSAKDLSLEFAMDFEPIEPGKARHIVGTAAELPWRDAPEYKLPLFSWDNRFEKMLTDLPSEQTPSHVFWWPCDYDCRRDDTTGYGDRYSLTIDRRSASNRSSAWSIMSWRWPFNEQRTANRRFRLSAMVKTRDCTGSVRLGHYSSLENIGDMYYGGSKSHLPDRTPKTNGIVWEYSKSLTGTTDWTPLSLEFAVKHFGSTLMLEQTGAGQCWFDNVMIEVVEEIRRKKAKD